MVRSSPLDSCSTLYLVSWFSYLISHQCFLLRVIFPKCKSNHVIALLKTLQWLVMVHRSIILTLAHKTFQVWQHFPFSTPSLSISSCLLLSIPAHFPPALMKVSQVPKQAKLFYALGPFVYEASSFACKPLSLLIPHPQVSLANTRLSFRDQPGGLPPTLAQCPVTSISQIIDFLLSPQLHTKHLPLLAPMTFCIPICLPPFKVYF